MSTLSAVAPAKINLTLRVLGRRPDGFHDIESLVARIDLCDQITAAAQEDGSYALECDDPSLPCDGSNLVLQAARSLARARGINRGVFIKLSKRIPAGSGLGGGSSDAATTLRLLNELWGLRLDNTRLAEIAVELGSDVPLFLHGPLTIVRGRGDKIEDVPQKWQAWAALLFPEIHCSTPAVYAAWDRLTERPPRPALTDVLTALRRPADLMERLFNDLEPAALAVVPQLRALAQQAMAIAGGAVRMSGSGSALFRLFADRQAAKVFADRVTRELGVPTTVVRVGNT